MRLTRLTLVAIVLLFIASITLNLQQRSDFLHLRRTIYGRCQHRNVYDTANHEAVGGQLAYMEALQRQAVASKRVTAAFVRSFPKQYRPQIARLEAQQTATLQQAINTEMHAYQAGVIGNCNAYK
jgi:multidrug resistance efflux pump